MPDKDIFETDPTIAQDEVYFNAMSRGRDAGRGMITADTLEAPVGDFAGRDVVSVLPTTSVTDAVNIMRSAHIGCVTVEQDGAVVGIFTERDVLRRVALQEAPFGTTPVSEMMTPSPEVLDGREPVARAINLMVLGGYRHIPIVNESGRSIGIVSIRDIASLLADSFPEEVAQSSVVAESRHGG